MKDTKIEWCDHSWSPWRGCTKVSPGCANCYAETLSKRNPAVLGEWGRGKPRVKAKNWHEPRNWNRQQWCENCKMDVTPRSNSAVRFCPKCRHETNRRKVTVFPSLCDIFDDEVEIGWLAEYFQLIYDTPNLLWLVLTKRPQNWEDRIECALKLIEANDCKDPLTNESTLPLRNWLADWFVLKKSPANVWVGTSVEDQTRADERIPALLRIPARGRFLSLEPLLGPVDLEPFMTHGRDITDEGYSRLDGLDWLIIGGESGNGSRECNVKWIRSLVAQGTAAGVPTFVKQLGARPVADIHDARGHYLGFAKLYGITHPKGGDPAEWPEDLRLRQFPAWGGAS